MIVLKSGLSVGLIGLLRIDLTTNRLLTHDLLSLAQDRLKMI